MKKIIYTTIAAFFGVALFASSANAQAVFNNPAAMPTITVANSTQTVCNQGTINGCWRTSTTAQAGDVVAVHLFYHNTSNTTAQGTTLSVQPQSGVASTSINFTGGVASLSGPRTMGSATVSISSSQSFAYIPGSGRWYPSATSGTRTIDSNALFSSNGFNIGTVNPGEQGVLVVFFQISNNTTPTYQCNDNVDNDLDGKIDYPNDPGCYGPNDNDESNVVEQCVINSFYATPTTVSPGSNTTLSWSTTGCDSLTIDGIPYQLNASSPFGPLYSSRVYELRAIRGSSVQTRQAPVNVTQVNSTYQCNDGYDNDSDGRVDYPNDSGCYSPTDNDEYNQVIINPTYQCNDGYDNDSDGRVDYPNDPGCSSYLDDSEYNQVYNQTYQCNDGYDNDSDGRVDYPNDSGCYSPTDNDEYSQVIINTQPQAITTVASAIGQNSARLNGIAVSNSGYNTTAWFDWGTSGSLGSRTNSQSVSNSNNAYYSDSLSGLTQGGVYYYRAVVQSSNGTAYGEIVRFQTTVPTNPTPPTVITRIVRVPTSTVVTTKSTPSLLELKVENVYDRMCVGGEMDYNVTYRNISSQTLQNAVLRITHPKELTFINSSRGNYEVVDRTVTISLGDIRAGEQGVVQLRARVNSEATTGNLAVTTATVVYTNTITRAQEDAIAYSLITVSNDCPNVLGASAFGLSSFFPNTLIGWLLLILIILALIVIGRQIYKKKEQA